MNEILWTAVFAQMMMGAFDTIYHHEGTERLAWRASQRIELNLHGVRNLAYAIMFTALGWFEPRGLWAVVLLALLAGELLITLWDFVEEDRTRQLPATERVTHTLLTLNYGVILAMLVPWLVGLARQGSELAPAYHGSMSWFCAIAALGVIVSGLRDLAAARRALALAALEVGHLGARLARADRGREARRIAVELGARVVLAAPVREILQAPGSRHVVVCADGVVVEAQRVNLSAGERRIASLPGRRTVKKDAQAAWLLKALTCIDLTTLNGDDTAGRVRRLCAKAANPVRQDLLDAIGMGDRRITTGAVSGMPRDSRMRRRSARVPGRNRRVSIPLSITQACVVDTPARM